MPPLILSIEGNIGAGKSTFVTEIQDKLGHREDICFLQEPVEEWKTEPTTAYDRVLKRNRSEESIPLAYLEKCHKYHEKWLSNMENVHIVDGNHENTIEVVEQQISRIISSFISYEK